MGISPELIQGYNQEANSRLGVAAAALRDVQIAKSVSQHVGTRCSTGSYSAVSFVSKLTGYDVSVMGTAILEDE